MPTITIPLSLYPATSNFFQTVVNTSSIGGDTWANRWPGVISSSLSLSTGTTSSRIGVVVTVGGNISTIRFPNVGFDMSDYSLLTITGGRINFKHFATFATGLWGTAAGDSITLVSQRETVRGAAPAGTDYLDIYDGAVNGTEFTDTRLPISGLVANTDYSIEFNAACVAYLNTVAAKTDLSMTAFMGLVFGGMADDTDPSPLVYGVDNSLSLYPTYSVELDYTSSPVLINIGDAWKNVASAQVNATGVAWKYISDVNVNVGDDWKDIA